MIAEPIALTPGAVVERFTIDRVIAFSASSITYRATDTLSGSPFVLREHVPGVRVVRGADGSFQARDGQAASGMTAGVARFLADSARAATLHHPGIAAISRWFRAHGTAYLVMPWLPGTSLASMLHDGRILSAPQALALALPLLDALDYLHTQEVIHQELSPGYVHVLEAGGALLLGCGTSAAQDGAGGIAPVGHNAEAYAAIEQFLPDRKTGRGPTSMDWQRRFTMASAARRRQQRGKGWRLFKPMSRIPCRPSVWRQTTTRHGAKSSRWLRGAWRLSHPRGRKACASGERG